MPLVAWCALAYAAGLFIGFTLPERDVLVAAAALAGLTVATLRLRRGWVGGVTAIAAGGVLVALGDATHERACGDALVRRRQWELAVERAVADGDVARGWISALGCRRRATVFVESGDGTPGARLALSGRAEVGDRAIVVRAGRVRAVGADALLPRLRAQTGTRIDRIFASDAPLVRALVIADMSAIEPAQRDRYADAGLVHMLSVSGLHVGIIALSLELLGAALRLPRAPTRVGSLALLVAYVAAIGAPPPAVRAAVMLGVLLVSRLRQRPTSRWAILALGGAVPLVVPSTVLDLGWQLSVAGTAALVAGGTLARRLVPRAWRGVRRTIATGAIISLVATATTAPLVAWAIGRVALVGPLTNLVADPIMGLLQPLLFVALCIPIPPVEAFCADAAHALVVAFDAIARAGAAAVAALVACASARPVRALLVGLSAIAALVLAPIVRGDRPRTELHVLDVGQGDAIALRTRKNRWVLVDAGRSWLGGDAGRSTVVPYLAHRGGALALFVLSHPHADHVGGAASVFASLRPGRFLDPGYVGTTPPYLAALGEAARAHIPWQRVRPGDSLRVDEVTLMALAPDSSWVAGLSDANLASTVIVARVGSIRFLFTGDAEGPEEEWLLARDPGALAADVLKVGHHGSRTSTSARFLGAVRPRLALVSVGAHNAYGHPSPDVLQALRDSGAQVLRTDRVGTIVVSTDGRTLEVEARDERWSIPDRPSH